ncbi:hypothetical protein QE152_g931 [Popillia japonica]|uniref:Uncharacterized protein n=1 Tax=Popillia japonica TaxID=7064 RepID=A0AAW1NC54_POPJA
MYHDSIANEENKTKPEINFPSHTTLVYAANISGIAAEDTANPISIQEATKRKRSPICAIKGEEGLKRKKRADHSCKIDWCGKYHIERGEHISKRGMVKYHHFIIYRYVLVLRLVAATLNRCLPINGTRAVKGEEEEGLHCSAEIQDEMCRIRIKNLTRKLDRAFIPSTHISINVRCRRRFPPRRNVE